MAFRSRSSSIRVFRLHSRSPARVPCLIPISSTSSLRVHARPNVHNDRNPVLSRCEPRRSRRARLTKVSGCSGGEASECGSRGWGFVYASAGAAAALGPSTDGLVFGPDVGGRLIHALGASNRPARPPDPRSPGVASTGCSSVRVRFSPPSIARGRSSVRGRADRPPPARSAAVCVLFSESGKVYSVRLSASRTGCPSGLPGAFPAITAWPPTGSGATGECWPGHESAGPAALGRDKRVAPYRLRRRAARCGPPVRRGLRQRHPHATTSQASAAANGGPAASGGRGRLILGRIGQIGPAAGRRASSSLSMHQVKRSMASDEDGAWRPRGPRERTRQESRLAGVTAATSSKTRPWAGTRRRGAGSGKHTATSQSVRIAADPGPRARNRPGRMRQERRSRGGARCRTAPRPLGRIRGDYVDRG